MRTIKVDVEVYKKLRNEKGLTPNETLRKRFGLKATTIVSRKQSDVKKKRKVTKATDLSVLIGKGLLEEKQSLSLRYTAKDKVLLKAHVCGKKIKYKGEQFSLTGLAVKTFKEVLNYKYKSARGPEHWFTADGKNIVTLWNEAQK